MALLYSNPMAAHKAPRCKGGDLVLYINQATRYFWPFLPLIDTDGINLPSFKKKKELLYQVTPDLPSGLILDEKTGLVRVDGALLTTQETIHYTFTVLYEFNIAYNTIGIKIEPCPISTCLELTVQQPNFIYALPYGDIYCLPVPCLPAGITVSGDKLVICGAKLCPQESKEYIFETKNGMKYVLCIVIHQVPYFKTILVKKRLTVGQEVKIVLPIIKGGTRPFTYEITPCLPAGLYIDACSGLVLGAAKNPMESTTYVIMVRDNNCVYTTNSVSLELSIKPALCSTSGCEDCLSFTVNQKDTFFCPFEIEGGYVPYVYSVCPVLPQGFHLCTKTGSVTVDGSALKPMSVTVYVFKACDDEEMTLSKTVYLTVNPTPYIDPCHCADIVLTENQGDKVLTVLKTVGGTEPLIYSVNPDLPPGIELNRLTGELLVTSSALVASEKTVVYSFTVVDKYLVRVVAKEQLKIRVTGKPSAYCHFSCHLRNTARLLKSHAKTSPRAPATDIALIVNKTTKFSVLKAFNGACPLTYYVSKGCLPDFLTLDPSSGVLSGTPLIESKIPYAFTIAVKDKNKVSAAYECSITIVIQCQACFPGKALVKLENGQTLSLTELKIGDKIQTGANRLSEVFLFTHALPTAETPFVELTTANGYTIVLSAGHYLYVNGTLEKAETVTLNDTLRTEAGESAVTQISHVRETGLYNPHTLDGDIMINGVCTSTYTDALRPELAHCILAPVRYLYSFR